MQDLNCKYESNAAVMGGVYSISNTSLNVNFTTIQYNNAHRAGVLHIENNSTMYTTRSTYTQNGAYLQGGVYYVMSESSLFIDDCDVKNNWANDTSVLYAMGGSRTRNITIANSRVSSNTAIKNSITLMYTKALLTGSTFEKNYATQRSKNVFTGHSDVYVIGCMFKSFSYSDPLAKVATDNTTGTYFYIILDTNILIKNSYFYDGLSAYGGALYILGEANVTISSSRFLNNYAFISGGAIYANNFVRLDIRDSTSFTSNKGIELGDDIYAAGQRNSTMILTSISFNNPTAKSSIYAQVITL